MDSPVLKHASDLKAEKGRFLPAPMVAGGVCLHVDDRIEMLVSPRSGLPAPDAASRNQAASA